MSTPAPASPRAQSGIAPRFTRGNHAEQRRAGIALRIGAPIVVTVAIEV
jgi:hypothetical protein